MCVWTSGWTPGVLELTSARYDTYTIEEVRRRNLGQTFKEKHIKKNSYRALVVNGDQIDDEASFYCWWCCYFEQRFCINMNCHDRG